MDFSIFLEPGTWVQLLTLVFLELVLGVDNLVFIAITTDRLPDSKKALGRRFGLVAALIMRIILLCFAAWLVRLQTPLFTLPFGSPVIDPAISGRDLVLLLGGAYLVVKGVQELREKISLREEEHAARTGGAARLITLPAAIMTIAVMDIVFSLDSVITAVGLSGELLVMIPAVMLAVLVMIIFANPISEFINANHEMKLLALVFIVAVGVKLVIESLGVELLIEGSEVDVLDAMLYFAMGFSIIITALIMTYNARLRRLKQSLAADGDRREGEAKEGDE